MKTKTSIASSKPKGLPFRGSTEVVATVAAATAMLLFTLPLLGTFHGVTSGWPGLLMTGDIRLAWFPHYVEGYNRFWNGSIFGSDFLTHGGASDFAMRPNMMPLYPPFLISYLIFNISDIETAAFVFCMLYSFHVFIGTYTCVVLSKRYLGLSKGTSVLCAFTYILSFPAASFVAYTPFFFQAMLVPVVSLVACRLAFARRVRSAVLASPVFVMYMLTSYGPMMVGGFVVAGSVTIWMFLSRFSPFLTRHIILTRFGFLSISILVSFLISLPYYLGQADLMQIVSAPQENLKNVAHDFTFTGKSLLSALTQNAVAPQVESRLFFGLIPTAVVALGAAYLAVWRSTISRRWASLFYYCIFAYAVSVIISLGPHTIGSDIFYYLVPGIGSMHKYGRLLLFTQLYFSLALAISAQWIVTYASGTQRVAMLTFSITFWLLVSFGVQMWPGAEKSIFVDQFLPEPFLFMMAIATLALGFTGAAVVVLAVPVVLISATPLFSIQREFGQHESWRRGTSKEIIDYSSPTADRLVSILKSHPGGKALPKVLSVAEDIDTYLPLNHSWILSSRFKFSNYSGYDAMLGVERRYLYMMGAWFGRFNREWVLRTGADFVLWDAASEWKLRQIAVDTVTLGTTHPLGGGFFLTVLEYAQRPHIGQGSVLVSLDESDPVAWRVVKADGWEQRDGRMVNVLDGRPHRFGLLLRQAPGASYVVTIETVGSTAGSISMSLGGRHGEVIPGNAPGIHSRIYSEVDGLNDLWIASTADFDGAVRKIVVQEAEIVSPARLSALFDNGLIRLEGTPNAVEIKSFRTNWSTMVRARISGAEPSRLVWLLWPNTYMQPYLNGQRVDWVRIGTWPAYLELPSGEHLFELRFESRWATMMRLGAALHCILFILLLTSGIAARWYNTSSR